MPKYTDAQRAETLAALQANNGNVAATSRNTGISDSTIRYWRDNEPDTTAELRDIKKTELADRIEEIAYDLVNAIPGKIPEANLQHVSTSLGIAIDKLRLLRGESTNIEEVRGESNAKRELADRLARQLAAARDGSGRSPN